MGAMALVQVVVSNNFSRMRRKAGYSPRGGYPAFLVAGFEQHLDALLSIGDAAGFKLFDDLLHIVGDAPDLRLPVVILPVQDGVGGAVVFVARESTTANIYQQQVLPAPRVGDVQVSEG